MPRAAVLSEQSPSNVSEEPSVLEQDNVRVGVKQGGDGEGLSLAGLQKKTRNTRVSKETQTWLVNCREGLICGQTHKVRLRIKIKNFEILAHFVTDMFHHLV